LRVGVIVFPGYELMFLAREMGMIDPSRIRLVEMRDNTDTIRALASNQLDAAAMTLDELMTARADGVNLRAVLVFDISAGADAVLARRSVTLATLAGKRVGVEDGAMGAVMLSALLDSAGLRLDQITKVPLTLDRSEDALMQGRVDAVVTAEPWASRLEKSGAHRIFDSTAIPNRIVDVLAVRADAISNYGDALKHLVAGHFSAQQHFKKSPAEAAKLMAARLAVPAPEVADLYRGLRLPDPVENMDMLRQGGKLDSTTQELHSVMLAAGLLSKSSAIRDVADARFLSP
jgi:NitT/TauT family transport system substrate-binding protein